MQLPVGKKASLLGGILLSTGLLAFPLQHRERQAQNPADRLTSGAGPRERSNKRRWRRAAKKPGVPLGRERRRARLYPSNISRRRFRPLGTLWLRRKQPSGEAEGHFAVSDALQRIATPYGSSATPLIAGNELRAVRFDPPLPFDSGGARQFLEQARGLSV